MKDVQSKSGKKAEKKPSRASTKSADGLAQVFFDNIPAISFIKDVAGRYLHINQGFTQALGVDAAMATGKQDDEIFDAERAAQFRRHARNVLDTGNALAVEEQLRCANGMRAVIFSCFPLHDQHGSLYAVGGTITDITERKQSEVRFRSAFEQSTVGIIHSSLDERCLLVNRKFCDMLGYSRDELLRKNMADIVHPDDRNSGCKQRQQLLAGTIASFSGEKRYCRKDGTVFWVNHTVSVARDDDGAPLNMISIIEDITARKQVEAKLEQTFEQASTGIVRTDLDRRIIACNRKFCEMTGFTRDELVGTNLRRLSHPEDQRKDETARIPLLSGATDHLQSERRYIRKNGDVIWVRRTTSLARDIVNNTLNYIFVTENITETRVAESSYRATFDMAPVGIMHSAPDRRILHVNRRLCDILGYTRDELLAMTTTDLLPPEHRQPNRPEYMEQMLQGKMETFTSQRPYMRKDGSPVWINRSVSLVRDSGGQPLYFLRVIEDISERKRAEDALAQERQLLRTVIDAIPDRIYVKDNSGRFMLQNISNMKVRGVDRHEDIVGKTVFDFFPLQQAQRLHDEDQKIISSGKPLVDREYRNSGSAGERGHGARWHLTTKVPLKDASGAVYGLVGINRDITERKQAEARITRLNRFFSTLSAANAAIARARDRETLFSAICRIVVDEGGLGCAWIRVHDPETRLLRIVAHAGVSKQDFSDQGISVGPEAAGSRGLAATSFRENRVLICNDILNEPALQQWHRRATEHGYHSLASLPLARSDAVIAVLTLHAKETDFFDDEVVRLLQQMAGDISFALNGLHLQEQHQATLRALQASDEQFRQLAQHIPQVFWITDADMRKTIYVSPTYETVTGQSLRELEENPQAWLMTVHPDDRERVLEARMQNAPLGTYDVEYRLQRADGTISWIHDRAFPVKDVHGNVYRIAGIAEDVTERKQAREHLAQLAHYDNVTGLPNRVLLHDRLGQSIAQARRNNRFVGVLFIDLDRFKLINDTLGHAAGDLLLKQVAARMSRALRPSDTVGRLSGDEFAIILPELAEPQNAGLVAQKVIDALKTPFDLNCNEVFVTASIGITLYPSDSETIETLIRDADAAMYSAKSAGRNNYQYYTAEMNRRVTEKLRLESRLRRAIDRQEFALQYQPKVDIATGKITGLEALLRWHSPDDGMVPPDQFIPLLEETGLIVQVGDWVLRTACAQIRAWRKAGITPVPVAINLSARQLRHQGFGATLGHALTEHDVPAALIEIEITESSLMENPEQAIVVLGEIESLGVRLSADDFGTGYSSLSYLKRFPLNALKIDRSFVRDITTDPDDAAITRTVITLAHGLDLKVIAEGVETEEQLAFLGQNQCDEAQGYLFSQPLAIDACTALLSRGSALHPARIAKNDEDVAAVLVVDDDSIYLELTQTLLQRSGYRVIGTTSVRDAFELLATNRVGIIVSDENMPGMSGVEFLRRVKSMYPEAMRIMFSGAGDFGTSTAAINEGEVHRFFVKGRDEELLIREISKKLRQERMPKQAHQAKPAQKPASISRHEP